MSQTGEQGKISDNRIELKCVKSLCGMTFYIPNYQRGYRWTDQQVNDLLNDINEFNDANGFYCLQPLVVKQHCGRGVLKKTKEEASDINDGCDNPKGTWEVIDGQQRLTTICILMKCLGIYSESYSLKYATRCESEDFFKGNLETNESNIDYYYISKAKQTIDKWLEKKDGESFQKKLLERVHFIWYESIDEDPIKVFMRLNIGKISLSNSELIKALFLNRMNFNANKNEHIEHIKLRQQEIASEWDKIEYTLQNNEFWLFIHEKGYKSPTRIDFIFELICEANDLDLDYKENIGTDDYRTFRYFYKYFKPDVQERNDSLQNGNSKITKCWSTVKRYYQTFEEWFNNIELFHYIGFLIDCKGSAIVKTLLHEWNQQTEKKLFIQYVKNEIKAIIGKCPKLENQYKEDGSNKRACKPILLFHNIQTVINQNHTQLNNEKYGLGTFYKFPFHLYKLENWDVEHINSNTTNPGDDVKSQKEWLLNFYLSVNENLQKNIQDFFSSPDNKDSLFGMIKNKIPSVNKEWTQEEKNRLWNYVLLDSSTNRSYGNSIFSGKRRVIIGKDKGKLIAIPKLTKDGKLTMIDEQNSSSSFVPPCTKQVFLKYYSATAGNNNYWTREDAQSYLDDIKSCIDKL